MHWVQNELFVQLLQLDGHWTQEVVLSALTTRIVGNIHILHWFCEEQDVQLLTSQRIQVPALGKKFKLQTEQISI